MQLHCGRAHFLAVRRFVANLLVERCIGLSGVQIVTQVFRGEIVRIVCCLFIKHTLISMHGSRLSRLPLNRFLLWIPNIPLAWVTWKWKWRDHCCLSLEHDLLTTAYVRYVYLLLLMMLLRCLMAVWDSLLLDQRLCPGSMRVHYLVIGLSALPACLLTLKDLNLVL